MLALPITKPLAARVQALRVWVQRQREASPKPPETALNQLVPAAAWMIATSGLVITAPMPTPNPPGHARCANIIDRPLFDVPQHHLLLSIKKHSISLFHWPVPYMAGSSFTIWQPENSVRDLLGYVPIARLVKEQKHVRRN